MDARHTRPYLVPTSERRHGRASLTSVVWQKEAKVGFSRGRRDARGSRLLRQMTGRGDGKTIIIMPSQMRRGSG